MATKLEDAEGKIGSLQKTLDEQSSKMKYLENQSRRNNIRVSGIPESVDETWEIVKEKVKKAIKEKFDMEIDIEQAHRVERKKKNNSESTVLHAIKRNFIEAHASIF